MRDVIITTQIPTEHSSLEIEVLGPNHTNYTHRGNPIWAHDHAIAVITSEDPDSPLYGEEIRVRLGDLRVAIAPGVT